MPIRLADPQLVTHGFQIGNVRSLVGGIFDDAADVDDRLGDETEDRGRADVLDRQRLYTECRLDALLLELEPLRPRRRLEGRASIRYKRRSSFHPVLVQVPQPVERNPTSVGAIVAWTGMPMGPAPPSR